MTHAGDLMFNCKHRGSCKALSYALFPLGVLGATTATMETWAKPSLLAAGVALGVALLSLERRQPSGFSGAVSRKVYLALCLLTLTALALGLETLVDHTVLVVSGLFIVGGVVELHAEVLQRTKTGHR